ncbi:hypothetical protein MRB53_014402 [Persea americana]|uniref:Uncharacterized protein n=1 Tax=Persea americana TaxID=3435 RepID=A0ACC2KB46_PERAE|nr:hypothetical protein MRB53_014402 [Persea americana]
MKTNLQETMTQGRNGGVKSKSDEDGVVRMKIVVTKQQLKQLMAIIGNGKNHVHQTSPSSLPPVSPLEQLQRIKQRRNQKRATNVKVNHRPWIPVLQSIPEEH